MVSILAKVKVKDFETWLDGFRKYTDKRADFGCKAETVFRPQAGSGDVFMLFEWSSEQAYREFMGWLRPQGVGEALGVITPPEHTILGERA